MKIESILKPRKTHEEIKRLTLDAFKDLDIAGIQNGIRKLGVACGSSTFSTRMIESISFGESVKNETPASVVNINLSELIKTDWRERKTRKLNYIYNPI